MALDKSLDFPEPHFPYLKTRLIGNPQPVSQNEEGLTRVSDSSHSTAVHGTPAWGRGSAGREIHKQMYGTVLPRRGKKHL